ncbi:hypothetical protein NECAME_06606 [Necator americanus]|uniref:Uncharacterized protein n=1 Tax=Necator americanus TaxID=51031 RepID=W2TTT2_NECAM|nr:hypothetical protein NECAME_06606 [Necator americanus]ETN85059.1 hypothetical protein NECAME_06606 [Necator americanus]
MTGKGEERGCSTGLPAVPTNSGTYGKVHQVVGNIGGVVLVIIVSLPIDEPVNVVLLLAERTYRTGTRTWTNVFAIRSSYETAEELDDPSYGHLRFQLSVDDAALNEHRVKPGRSEFKYGHFVFNIQQIKKVGGRIIAC